MNLPDDLRYTKSHEWLRTEADGTVAVGITDHAQSQLGDLVFLELPKPGRTVKAGEAVAVVESVKAASDVYAPVDGEIVGANDALVGAPEKVNEDAFGAWLFKLRPADTAAVASLLDADGYRASVGEG
jgi:glycine cleavage system H protein